MPSMSIFRNTQRDAISAPALWPTPMLRCDQNAALLCRAAFKKELEGFERYTDTVANFLGATQKQAAAEGQLKGPSTTSPMI